MLVVVVAAKTRDAAFERPTGKCVYLEYVISGMFCMKKGDNKFAHEMRRQNIHIDIDIHTFFGPYYSMVGWVVADWCRMAT